MRGPVDPDNLPEGTWVDCWRVVRRLDGGAHGTVYLVEKDGELYALKLARFLGHSGDARHTDERAQRELRCLLGLQEHPHLAQVRFHGRWPHAKTGFFYVVMDFVEGCTLAQWVERTRATPHEVVVLFEKVLSAVAHVHAQNMLHRDLKPNNILVEARTGRPVVVDFGAAYFPAPAEPRLTNTRLPPGTPHYTSPEARHFENLHRHDRKAFYEYKVSDELYALGVTLYDLLTDPQSHSHPRSQLQPQTGEPRAHEVNERVPLMLSEYTARLVAPGPALRPESAERARRDLAELLPMDAPEWRQRPLHAPVPPLSEAEEAAPLPSAAHGSQAPAEPQVPQPAEPDKPLLPEVHSQPPEMEQPPALGPLEPQAPAHVSTPAPAVLTPAPSALPAPPRPRRVGRTAVGALVLSLLVAAAAVLSVRPGAPEESAPVLLGEPAAPRPTLPEASEPTAASAPREAPPPPPPGAPPISTPEKGTPVNIRPPSQPATPAVCSQKQPPPRGTPAWLKWCQCTAIAGSLVASQAGCPGAQIRQSLTEQCKPESVQAMEALGIDLDDNDIDVELDIKQPSNGQGACGEDASGKVPIACIAEGPLTSRVVGGYRGKGKLVRGTLLSGYAWLHSAPSSRGMTALYRWTEATLPDGSKHPVCIEDIGQGRECPNGTAYDCAASGANAVRSFRPIKLDR